MIDPPRPTVAGLRVALGAVRRPTACGPMATVDAAAAEQTHGRRGAMSHSI